jgi:hypothetical protein
MLEKVTIEAGNFIKSGRTHAIRKIKTPVKHRKTDYARVIFQRQEVKFF